MICCITSASSSRSLRRAGSWRRSTNASGTGRLTGDTQSRTSMARKIRGGQNSRTKLTDDQARAIFASDESIAILAQRYGVAKGTIRDIQTGKSWIHIHENQELPERADVTPANPPGLPENVRAIRLADGSHAIIDAADAEGVAGRSWSFHVGSKGDNGAIYCSERAADGGERRVALHRLLLDAPPDHLVIHRDGDPFNNRRSNLALITPEYRSHRAKRSIRNTSG